MNAESIPGDPGAALEADVPTLRCPSCGESFQRQEDLDRHRERHRPVMEKAEGTVQCPKGCGRWLAPNHPDTLSHIALCDGLEPIPMAKRGRWTCEEHGFTTNGPKPWGLHKKEFHKVEAAAVKAPKKPRKKRGENLPVDSSASQDAAAKGEEESQMTPILNDQSPMKRTKDMEFVVELLKRNRVFLAQELERVDSALKVLCPDPGIGL